MITIKTVDAIDNEWGRAEIHIVKDTPYSTMILGTEMLIEALLKEVPTQTIDDLLADIKRIYERDNKDEI